MGEVRIQTERNTQTSDRNTHESRQHKLKTQREKHKRLMLLAIVINTGRLEAHAERNKGR